VEFVTKSPPVKVVGTDSSVDLGGRRNIKKKTFED